MLKKHNNSLIFDYITGKEIENIEELENDFEFMKQVINHTNDKKIYNLCSNDLKNNYLFIKFMINKFSNNHNFIITLAHNYLENHSDEEIACYELTVLMNKYLNNTNESLYFKMKLLAIKTIVDVSLEEVKKDLPTEILQEIGLGFYLILTAYQSSEIVTDYFAKEYLKKIFYNNDQTFEQLIHSEIKDYSTLDNQGINNYLINYIQKYDQYLADYISVRIYLLEEIKEELTKVIANWQNYISKTDVEKNQIFQMEVKNFLYEEFGFSNTIDEIVLINYLCDKLNLEKVKEYLNLNNYENINYYESILSFFKDNFDLNKQQKLQKLESKIKELYEVEKINRSCDDYDETKYNTKVIYANDLFKLKKRKIK